MKRDTQKEKIIKDSRESREARYLRVSQGPKFRPCVMKDNKKEASKKRCRKSNYEE